MSDAVGAAQRNSKKPGLWFALGAPPSLRASLRQRGNFVWQIFTKIAERHIRFLLGRLIRVRPLTVSFSCLFEEHCYTLFRILPLGPIYLGALFP
jgi:hypothetical protein